MKNKYMKTILLIFAILISRCAMAQPSNDNPCFAIPLTVVAGSLFDESCTTGTMYNHTGATASTGSFTSSSCYSQTNPDVWFSVVVPSTGNIMLNTSEPSGGIGSSDLTMAVYTATLCSGIFTLVACNDDGRDELIGFYNPIIRLTGRAPGEILFIRIRVLAYPTANFNFRLCAKNLGTSTPPPISTGNYVGIGNPTPEGHLDVNGDAIVRRDFYVGRTANFNGNASFNGNLTFNKNFTVSQDATFKGKIIVEDSLISQGFTKLGSDAPKIKMKEILGNKTSTVNNGSQPIPLTGINITKIIAVNIFVGIAGNAVWLPPIYDNDPRLKYNYFLHTNGNLYIQNSSTDCTSPGDHICNKDVKIVITYKE